MFLISILAKPVIPSIATGNKFKKFVKFSQAQSQIIFNIVKKLMRYV